MNELFNNQYIKDLYDIVEKFENNDENAMGYHNFSHAVNVTKLLTTILKQLKFDEDKISDLQVASMLHDIGAYCGKKDHHIRSYEMSKDIVGNIIPVNDVDYVLKAILNHSDSFDNDDLGIVALIFCDKMDMTKDRVAPAGRLDDGMSQFLFVDEVKIEIENSNFNVTFVVNEECDFSKLNNYYFIPKMFKAVEALSSRLGLKANVYYNNVIWKKKL